MSTGLMSCVRQNSPPLELSASSEEPPSSRATTISAATAQRLDDVSSLNTTQKRRRRFMPLRNLFRIFRIGTPDEHSLSSSAYRPASEPEQSDDNTGIGGGGSSRLSPPDTPIRVVASSAYPNSTSCDSLLYSPQRPHREQRRRQASTGKFDQNTRTQHKPVLHLRKSRESLYRENVDSTDFQRRSISDYLGGSDMKSESLSQSHDSVFSESVTASSMSIGLKAELASVLRKKYHDSSVCSDNQVNNCDEDDEDLGFPRSPNTPKRGERMLSSSVPAASPFKHIGHNISSDGSLKSSMGSTELIHHNSSTGNKNNKFYKLKSESRDDLSKLPTPLNHSAARHKMAIRPKKKAPSRLSRIPNTVIEIEPQTSKPDITDSGTSTVDSVAGSTKSSSLPHGVDAKQSLNQTVTIKPTKSTSVITSKHLYVSPELSSRYNDFETTSSSTSTTYSQQNLSDKDKEVNGFFRRLLTRGSLKKKVADESSAASPTLLNTIVAETVDSNKPKVAAKPEKAKSGPAARQRIQPREIPGSPRKPSDSDDPSTGTNVVLNKPSSPSSGDASATAKLVLNKSSGDSLSSKHILNNQTSTEQTSTTPVSQSVRKSVVVIPSTNVPSKIASPSEHSPTKQSTTSRTFEPKPIKSGKVIFGNGITRVSSDYQIKKDDVIVKDNHHQSNEHIHRHYKVQSQSTSCIARATMSFDHPAAASSSSSVRKPVEKSKSFRFYSETTPTNESSPMHTSSHMPSLPDLSFTSSTSNSNSSAHNTSDIPNYRELINRFEINDNNLMGPASKSSKNDPAPTGSRNTVYITTSYDATTPTTGVGGEQIVVEKLKTSPTCSRIKLLSESSASNITQIENNIDHIMKFGCVTVCKTSAPVSVSMSKSEPHKTSIPSILAASSYNKTASTEDDNKERRFSNESVEITDKLPPTSSAVVIAPSTVGVIVERRKSVSDEKLKFERKIQERSRNSSITIDKEQSSRKSSLSEGDAIGSPVVVLRKKSISYGSRPATTTATIPSSPSPFMADAGDEPELMKVFARRSLKLKDQDDFVVCSADDDEIVPITTIEKPPTEAAAIKKPIADSSSATTIITTATTTTNTRTNQNQNQLPQTAATTSVVTKPMNKSATATNQTPPTTTAVATSATFSAMSAHSTITTSSTTSVASRLSGYQGLIAQSTINNNNNNNSSNNNITNNHKTISSALLKPATLIANTLVGNTNTTTIMTTTTTTNNNSANFSIPVYNNNNNNKSNTNNNNNNNLVLKTKPKGNNTVGDDVNENHLVDDMNGGGGGGGFVTIRKQTSSNNVVRATTICESPGQQQQQQPQGRLDGVDEFKGILQRRAEWEKRATQTFK